MPTLCKDLTAEQIETAVRGTGNITKAAATLGVSAKALDARITRLGNRETLAKIRDEFARANPTASGKATRLDPASEISAEEMLKARNKELEKAAKSQRAEKVAEERLLQRLEAVIPTVTSGYVKPVIKDRKSTDDHELVLLFSDTHAGETVSSEETLGMNSYSWEIMLERMARLQESVLSFVAHRPYRISKLHVWFLGDMLSGSIHDELAQTNEMSDAQAIVQFATDSKDWLLGFADHFDEIEVSGVPGNHPRRAKKMTAKRAANNDDWLTYQLIRLQLAHDPRFSWNIPAAAYAVTTVAERWRCLLMHGDGIRSSMPGVPWGGVVRRVTTLEQQFAKAKQPLDYVALGHFHTANALDGVGVRTFLNGSVKGLDEYSLKAFGSGRSPSQVMLTFHPKRGVTDISLIDLVDSEPAGGM